MTEIKLLNHQHEFLEDDQTRYLALVGGYGCGKTYSFCLKTIFMAAANVGYSGAIMEPTYGMVKRVLLPAMMEILADCGIKYSFSKSDSIFTFHFAEGDTTVYCLSAENYTRMAGMNLAFFGVDECDTINKEIARSMWNMAMSRLRSGRVYQGFTTSTPEGFNFLYEFFHEEADDKNDRRLIRGKTRDNPFLPPDFIQSLLDNYPEQLIKSYLEGEFVNLNSGAVYPNFDRKLNHSDLTLADFPNAQLHIGQDFNIGQCASVIAVIHPETRLPVIIDEMTDTYNTEQLITRLREKYGRRHITIYPDPAGGANKTSASQSDLAMLKQAGFELSYSKAHPPIKDRVNSVNAMLCSGTGNRQLLINTKTCKELTKCLEQQAYKNGMPDKDSGTDHMLDALGYFIYRTYPIIGRASVRQY